MKNYINLGLVCLTIILPFFIIGSYEKTYYYLLLSLLLILFFYFLYNKKYIKIVTTPYRFEITKATGIIFAYFIPLIGNHYDLPHSTNRFFSIIF